MTKKIEQIMNNIGYHPNNCPLPKLSRPSTASPMELESHSLANYYDTERLRLRDLRSEQRKSIVEKQEEEMELFKKKNKIRGVDQVDAKLANLLVLRYNRDPRMKEMQDNLKQSFSAQNRISRAERAYKMKLGQLISSQKIELQKFDRKVEVELQHFDSIAAQEMKNQTSVLRKSMPITSIHNTFDM
ncbi:hypothetical protein TVAG_351580 [Trichomonas vaginalis G3]|uniref:Uncharacterized protein n=1 Tax=Trichomonas vaginalis (strain ATCC PRA-98 / G3) TaxID=412133 RepID=A2DZP2_TRIV3|nr:hypothetical protein TVAGG3_0261120 [Trichomonas vaginalis G3]EAY14110.1 hypothetical protein TVAG_351580 [Trichomonas vaginalis G3]KAI5525119.1 hypothetical protein TVAGG3_0261120 [Trichomonas vaginalis G3]|eukprot:XP_001326333.1 hypothetical protein [Trichomonas vaginalis G3]